MWKLINQVIGLANGPSKTMDLAKFSSGFIGVVVSLFLQLLRLIVAI